MLRRTQRVVCTYADVANGKQSPYHPEVRPKRLVMPIDPHWMHSSERLKRTRPIDGRDREQNMLMKANRINAAVRLARVPEERSVADEYRLCLDFCRSSGWLSPECLRPRRYVEFCQEFDLQPVTRRSHTNEDYALRKNEGKGSSGDVPLSPTLSKALDTSRGDAVGAAAYSTWDLLEQTALHRPAHGHLAALGRGFVRQQLTEEVSKLYPRMRSSHLREALHHLDSTWQCAKAFTALGFVNRADLDRDVSMWRELLMQEIKLEVAKRELAQAKERHAMGVPQHRLWWWQKQVKQLWNAKRNMPLSTGDLRARMEWLRSHFHAFIAFVKVSEGDAAAAQLVRRLIIPAVASQVEYTVAVAALKHFTTDEANVDGSGVPLPANTAAKKLLRHLTSESFIVGPDGGEPEHPLNARADHWRMRRSSTAHGLSVMNYTDGFVDDEVQRYARVAPPLLVKLMFGTGNAFKEAQVVLKYAPDVPAALKDQPLDFDVSVVQGVAAQEHDIGYEKTGIDEGQGFTSETFTEMKFFAGPHCIGVGRGKSEVVAMDRAARQFLTNYYFRNPNIKPTTFRPIDEDEDEKTAVMNRGMEAPLGFDTESSHTESSTDVSNKVSVSGGATEEVVRDSEEGSGSGGQTTGSVDDIFF